MKFLIAVSAFVATFALPALAADADKVAGGIELGVTGIVAVDFARNVGQLSKEIAPDIADADKYGTKAYRYNKMAEVHAQSRVDLREKIDPALTAELKDIDAKISGKARPDKALVERRAQIVAEIEKKATFDYRDRNLARYQKFDLKRAGEFDALADKSMAKVRDAVKRERYRLGIGAAAVVGGTYMGYDLLTHERIEQEATPPAKDAEEEKTPDHISAQFDNN